MSRLLSSLKSLSTKEKSVNSEIRETAMRRMNLFFV